MREQLDRPPRFTKEFDCVRSRLKRSLERKRQAEDTLTVASTTGSLSSYCVQLKPGAAEVMHSTRSYKRRVRTSANWHFLDEMNTGQGVQAAGSCLHRSCGVLDFGQFNQH
ncbi:hypothetical protein LINGRAHAP2_LOCUS32627 [Linum grandiflorum]